MLKSFSYRILQRAFNERFGEKNSIVTIRGHTKELVYVSVIIERSRNKNVMFYKAWLYKRNGGNGVIWLKEGNSLVNREYRLFHVAMRKVHEDLRINNT